ncbi:toluene hydroxylase [Pseudonocardia sp.]|uniref:toluene hydroxylase n=1 Tax=Pseudonocardia sp. TaxID=60912 RepID=UPI003D0B584D
MTQPTTGGRTPRVRKRGLRTWSAFGNLGRRPTEYEIVTHNLNHTTGAVPLELGADVHGNRWLREHRDNSALVVPSWDTFRDPDAVTYGSYVVMQDDQETYVEKLLEQFDGEQHDELLEPAALAYLARALTPTRYLAHGLQMLSAYVQQLAPGSYVSTAAAFQTADQLRRVQLVAYRTTQLARTHPGAGFATGERATWERDPDWTAVRETVEHALVEFDWDRALVATQLVVKPAADAVLLEELGRELAAAGSLLDSLIVENLFRDAQRSQRWTAALLAFLTGADAANAGVLQGVLDDWAPRGHALIDAGARIVSAGTRTPEEIARSARARWRALVEPSGLRVDRS